MKPVSSGGYARSRGFTLIEFVAVVVLISLAVSLVINRVSASRANSFASHMADSVSQLVVSAPGVHKPTFAGLSCVTLGNNGAFDGTSFTYDKAAGKVYYDNNEPGTDITCAPVNVFGTNDGFTVQFPNLTDERCNKFVEQADQYAWAIKVNGTDVKVARGALDADVKGQQCKADATKDQQVVELTLRRDTPPQ